MRARIWSAACCISSSGSRIGAMRCATDDRRPICSARWRLSASARRSASFAALDLARPLGGPRGLLLRLDEPARRLVLLGHQQRLEPLVAELVERDERLGERVAVGAGPHQHGREAAVEDADLERRADEARASPDRRARPGPPRRAARPSTSPSSSRSSSRSSAAGAPLARPPSPGSARTSRHRPHPVLEDLVALRAEPGRRLLRAPGRAASRPLLPAVQPRDAEREPLVPHVARTRPRCMSAANASGSGKRATDAGRYA